MSPPPSRQERSRTDTTTTLPKLAKATHAPTAQLYHPSIFRFTCRGRLTLSSQRPYEAGVCRGVQTHLEHLDQWRLLTEEDAVLHFQQRAAVNDEPEAAPAATTTSDATAQALQPILLSNVLVYPPEKEEPAVETPGKQEDWSCYGSTEVDMLVLRPQDSQQERIAAVSPYCAPGMTIRDITADSLGGRDRTSTVRLGFLEILYQSSLDGEEETKTTTTTSSVSEKTEEHPGTGARIVGAAGNILHQMQINAQLIYQATQEDFPGRTVQASHRILQEFERTTERTVGLMKRVLFFWEDEPKGK